MELSQFQQEVQAALEVYEESMAPEDIATNAEALMQVIMARFCADGFDSIWYGRIIDRVRNEAYYGNFRFADDATFHGLVHLINRWSANLTPQAVQIDD